MTSIWYGRLLPVATLIGFSLFAASFILITNDPTGWAAIGIIAFTLILFGLFLIVYLIVGYIRQHRSPAPFFQGLIEGTWTMIALVILLVIVANILSAITL